MQTLRITFADAPTAVTFHLDDLMLIQNQRAIEPAPEGLKVAKSGLAYDVGVKDEKDPLCLAQGPDGFWRWNRHQPIVQLLPPGEIPEGREEDLDLMGQRRIGQVTLLENNALRVRLESAWFFPSRSGEWASSAARQRYQAA